MTQRDKLIAKIMNGEQDGNITFEELQKFLAAHGYELNRVAGSHFIFTRPASKPFNIQRFENGKAKRAQVREIRDYFKNNE